MKKVSILLFLALSITSFSQAYINKKCDDMTGKCIYYPSERIITHNSSNTEGVFLQVLITEKSNRLDIEHIICTNVNIGNCNENDNLILMFEDSTKINLRSWNEFNCEGKSYFSINGSNADKLASKKVIKLYFQNGRSYDSFTSPIDADQQNYFVDLMGDCRANKYQIVKE